MTTLWSGRFDQAPDLFSVAAVGVDNPDRLRRTKRVFLLRDFNIMNGPRELVGLRLVFGDLVD